VTLFQLVCSGILSFNSLSTPSTVSGYFSVEIWLYYDDGSDDYSQGIYITFTLDPSSPLTGTPSCSTSSSGICSASNFQSQNAGTFRLVASASGYTTSYSSSFTIAVGVSSITVTSSTSSPTVNFPFTITVSIYSSTDVLSTTSNSVTLSESGGATVSGTTTSSITGTGTFSIYFASSGSKTVVATCSSVTASTQVTVEKLKLVFGSFSPTTINTLNYFTVSVSVYDSTGSTVESSMGPYSISIAFEPTAQTDGTWTVDTTSGVATFSDLRIKSEGSYVLTATGTDITSGTKNLSIEKFTYLITLSSSNETPSVSFGVTITATLKNQDGTSYETSCDMTLVDSTSSMMGTTAGSNSDGTVSFSVYFTTPGKKTLTTSCPATDSIPEVAAALTITVRKLALKISSFTPPSNSLETFSVTVEVCDNELANVESDYGPYTISLSLDPSGVTSGVVEGTTNSGLVTFNNLRILTSGAFVLKASSENIVSAATAQFTTINFVYSIEVEPSKTELNLDEALVLDIKLYGEDQRLFVLSADITISEKNSQEFTGPDSVSTSTGKKSVSINFSEVGSKTLQVSVGDVATEVQINVIERMNPDVKCKIAISADVCSKCVTGANLFDGKCLCTLNSEYSSDKKNCVCDTGYKLVNNYCIQCGNYYKDSEISGRFSDDFSTVYLDFSIQPEENLPCLDFLILPRSVESINFYCVWDNILTLSIHFEKTPQVKGLIIGVDPVKLQKTSTTCNLAIKRLDIRIKYSGSLPTPTASINAPDHFSLNCSSSDLYISCPYSGRDFEYKWSATFSPRNSYITDKFKDLTSTSITIPLDQLRIGTLTLKLTISSESFQTSATVTKTIEIVSKPYLSIELSSGSVVNIKRSSDLSIKPMIKENCGETAFNYVWTWVNDDGSIGFSDILSASSKSGSLFIKQNTLEPDTSYIFKVELEGGSAIGSSTVTVNVDASPLLVTLSRSSGKIGNDTDFTIDSSVVDPDSETSTITYAWSCYEKTAECLDSSGSTLLTESDKSYLFISKTRLRDTAIYVFTLEATVGSRSKSASIQIEVQSGLVGQVSISMSPIKLNADSTLIVIPTILDLVSSLVSWEIIQGTEFSLPKDFTFFTIPAYTFTAGTNYELQLNLDYSGAILQTRISFSTNLAPKCESVTYSSVSSKKVRLIASNCVDGDDSDYPLKYQYGVGYSDSMNWISSAIFSSEYSVIVRPSAKEGYVKICDSLSSCLTSSVSFSTRRALDETSDEFEADASDIDSIPSAIAYYSDIATQDTIDKMVEKYFLYIEDSSIDSDELDLIINSVYFLSNAYTSLSSSQANTVVNSLISIIDELDFTLTDSQALSIYSAVNNIVYSVTPKNMRKLIEKVRYQWIKDKTPLSQIVFDSDLFVSHTRGLHSHYENFIISASYLSLAFPEQFLHNTTNVIDVSFAKFFEVDSPIFDLQVFYSGKYENLTLTLTDPERYTHKFSDSITLSYEELKFDSGSTCESIDYLNWTKKSCEVDSLSSSNLILDLSATTLFKVVKINSSTDWDNLCYYTIYVLLLVCIWFLLYIAIADNKIEEDLNQQTILNFYPFTSLMISQPKPWRLFYALHLISSELLLLLLIGGFYEFVPQRDEFLISITAKSGFCLLLSQSYSLPSIILIYYSLNTPKRFIIVYSLTTAVIILSFAGIIALTFQDLQLSAYNWIFGFLLYSTIDIIVVQLIYTLIWFKWKSKVYFPKKNNIKSISANPLSNITVNQDIDKVKPVDNHNQGNIEAPPDSKKNIEYKPIKTIVDYHKENIKAPADSLMSIKNNQEKPVANDEHMDSENRSLRNLLEEENKSVEALED